MKDLIKQINESKIVVVFCGALNEYIPVTKVAALAAIKATRSPKLEENCRLVGDRFIIG